jgi:hypothetical protein
VSVARLLDLEATCHVGWIDCKCQVVLSLSMKIFLTTGQIELVRSCVSIYQGVVRCRCTSSHTVIQKTRDGKEDMR